MDFSIPPALQEKLDAMRALLEERVVPLEPRFLSAGFAALEPELKKVRAEVQKAGLWGPPVPADCGGMGLSVVDHGLVSAVLGRSPLGHYCFGCQAPDLGNIEVLHKHATEAQHERFLGPLARGEIRSCFSMTEPDNPGSDPVRLSTTAKLDGDEWVIDGHKWFTTAADGADFAIVMAVTEPEGRPHERASMILVPTDTPGFDLVRNIAIAGERGDGWASHAEIKYKNCRVPAANLLGERGAGFRIAQERLGPGRIQHCMRWIGISERALDMMVARSSARHFEGKGPLSDKQIVQGWMAESRARIEAARWAVLHAAWKVEREGYRAARVEVSCIKFMVAEVMLEVLDRAVQVHGALGITSDTILGHLYAHERGARIYDGPDEVHKMVVARELLKAHARAEGGER